MELSLQWLSAGPLSGHGVLVLLFTVAIFAIFVWDRFEISSVCLAILILLPALFFVFPHPDVEPRRFLSGFGHPALVAICALMVLGHALVLTGALAPAARRLAWLVERMPRLALFVVLVLAGAASGIMNNTPVVVLLIPLMIAALRRAGHEPALMLMPMNGAVVIGGMATSIGTSTNLIVVSIAASMGAVSFGVFDFFNIVALAFVPALVYLWLIAPLLLRQVAPAPAVGAQPVFNAELRVTEGSWLDGAEMREVLRRAGNKLPLRRIRRANGALVTPLTLVRLGVGDRLIVQDTAANLKEHEARLKAPLHSFDEDGHVGNADQETVAAQLVVTPESPLVGRTVRGERVAERFKLIVIGLRKARETEVHRADLADLRVDAGDVLLMQGPSTALQTMQREGFGLLLDERLALPRQRHSTLSLVMLAAVVIAASVGGVPIEFAAMLGVLVLLATRTLGWHDVGASLSVDVVLLVVASLALGDALTVTGGTAALAQAFTHLVGGWKGPWILAALMVLMGLLTNFVSNNAAAAIGTPLSIEIARSLQLPVEPFVLAVLFGCNLCFVTPMGYQTNLLVMNAGGYRFRDFVRVGAPLFVIMWLGLSYLLTTRYAL